jgi:hypothetical protein
LRKNIFLKVFQKKGETFSISNILLQTIDIDQQRIAYSHLTIYLDLYASLRFVFPVSTSAHLPICPSSHLPICPSAHLPTCPPAHLPICPPAHLPTCPPATFLLDPLPVHNTS